MSNYTICGAYVVVANWRTTSSLAQHYERRIDMIVECPLGKIEGSRREHEAHRWFRPALLYFVLMPERRDRIRPVLYVDHE